ncbi:MAG: EAL domain-containing protein [Sulfurimonas sp.]
MSKESLPTANDNFCNLSLYTRDEVLGKPHSIVRHEDTKAELFTDLWKTILSKKVWRGEIKNRKKDGNFYIVDTVIAPILDENRAIREFLSIRHDITELKTKQAQLDTLANTDYLTGLQNRFSLNEKLARATSGQIALIDINRFHEINDFYGENIGDKVIKAVANQIQIQHSDSHQVFRLQGDQFIIFNTTQSQEQFQDEMLRLNNFLSNKILIIENKIFYISTTLALSFEEPALLLSTVNLAKTYAKQKGLTSNVYSPLTSLEEQYKENLKWDYKIRKALLEHRFVVYFQPIVDTKTQEIAKYEALIRMRESDGSILSPYLFLEQAKRSNQYIEITKVVIEKTLMSISERNIRCSINLTIEDIESESLQSFLFEHLQNFAQCNKITFELVESEGINNFEDVNAFIQKIKSFGCSIAIDDFGTGYSNFEYLLKLQADTIKIDGSLIKDIDKDQDKYDIVQTIVSFAKIKKLKVIAEFVSSQEIYERIKALDIDKCQGYYFGEPKPFDAIITCHGM